METRPFGNTGLKVSRLGIGLAEIGMHLPAEEAGAGRGRIEHGAGQNGINLLDTAACYGNSEELIGDAVSHRRGRIHIGDQVRPRVGGRDRRGVDRPHRDPQHRPQSAKAEDRPR